MKPKVIIRRCEVYDADRIAGIVKEGMEELGIRPEGRILLKPNVVIAHPEIFPYAFTRKEFLDGVIAATKARAQKVKEIAVGERSGITIPTRFSFKNAGYPEIIRKHKIKTYYFDESKQVPIQLKNEGRIRDLIFVPKPIADCDFLINLPKFKAHPWTRLTLSLKNFIGLQDDRHRLVDHNSFLEEKIADLQEVIQSKFIAIDGIIAGQKMMLTPTPFALGAIVMGSNSCAVDTVGCRMVSVDPKDLIHLRLASERGFGPMSLDEIEVGGDFPLEEVQEKTRNFQFCLGGCPGALQEAMHIFRGFYPTVDRDMKKVRYVVGKVEGSLDLAEDERVLFAGNCTSWEGNLNGRRVQIKSSYKPTRDVDARKTRSNDLFLKISKAVWQCLRHRNSRYLHMKGCTLSVADHVNYLSSVGKIKNPNFDHRLFIPVTLAYFRMQANRLSNRLTG
jgi:uncharacterized protein (DUF362 family)